MRDQQHDPLWLAAAAATPQRLTAPKRRPQILTQRKAAALCLQSRRDGSRQSTRPLDHGGCWRVSPTDHPGTEQPGEPGLVTQVPGSTPLFSPGGIFPDMRGAVTPTWSTNGRWIAFASNHEGNHVLHRIRPDGTGMKHILKRRTMIYS